MESTLVIKAKCGIILRRFNVPINEDGQLGLDMNGLRARILGLFNFPLDADVVLTYVDEDGDVVTLVDDGDLVDVMKQSLKFLRVDVQIKDDKFAKSSDQSAGGTSTPVRSPHVQIPLQNLNASLVDVLKAMPEPLCDTLSKLSLDLASRAACSNSVIADLVDCFSKVGQSLLNPAQQSQSGASSSANAGIVDSVILTVPNATNHETSQEVTVEKVNRGVAVPIKPVTVRSENVSRGMGVPLKYVLAPVGLNSDPLCDYKGSGCVAKNFELTVNDDERKDNKKQNLGNTNMSFQFGGPSDSPDSAKPSGNGCPFRGLPMENDFSSPPIAPPRINSCRRSSGRGDAMVGMFHRGVQCDGCGVHPITGPRFKSKLRDDFDLCSICFTEIGDEDDYIKIDRPVSYRHPRPFKGLQDPKYWVGPTPMHAGRYCRFKPVRSKLDCRFISDVNVLDGTMMAPSTLFTKIWRLRNSGNVAWPQGAQLVWIGGDRFSHSDSAALEIPADGLPVDGEIDVAVDFTSPKLCGRYISYWRMASPSGVKFGQRVWVLINVVASMKDSVSNEVGGLNLNFPPDCSDPKVIDLNVRTSGTAEPCNPTSASASVPRKPVVENQQLEKDQAVNFPINDSLFVGNGVAIPPSPQASSTVTYPIIDLSEVEACEPAVDIPTSSEQKGVREDVEKSLLKELDDMGFTQVDLNKEILRMNEYSLEQSVDHLCGVSNWDPILEELQEMGFRNEEMNRKLLKKNNGSITGVVMDLLTGEKGMI